MALVLLDRAKETTNVTGTGPVVLLGAVAGYQSLAGIGNGNATYYCIEDKFSANWEVTVGTWSTGGTITRAATPLSSSNAGALVNFPAGIKDVFVTYPAEKGVWLDASGNAIGLGTPTAFVGTNITGTASGLTAGNVTTNANLTGAISSTGNATSLGSFTSAELASALTNETGSGLAVFATSPTLSTPTLVNANATGILTAASIANLKGMFTKGSSTIVSFVTTGAFAVSTQTQLYLEVNGLILAIASGTVVAMPSAVTGTDYAIWAETAGTLTCTNNHTTPPTANARKIGGFHYAPGGNATAQSGGNTTPYINQYSFWDLKFKPACQDPRGMTLVAGNFWADIYLLNTDPDVNGTSKYNVTIADGASPPKVPTKFGGNGTTAYTTLTWWEANEVLAANGKRSASYQEYAALAFGTTEGSSLGTDPGSTILNAAYTSRWGVMQATGVMWVWGKDFGGGAAAAGWVANTTGRGQTYQLPNAVRFGGYWGLGADAGSRCSAWNSSPAGSDYHIGGRGVVDHLLLD